MKAQPMWRRVAFHALLLLGAALVGCSDNDPAVQTSGLIIEGDPGVAIPLPDNPEDIVAIDAILDLDGTLSYNSATGKMTLHFLLTDAEGNGISLTENSCSFRAYASRLSNNSDAVDPGPRWQQLLGERGNSFSDEDIAGLFVVHDGNAGDYSYTFEDADGVLADSINSAAPDAVFRVTLRTRCRTPDRIYVVNPVNGSYDFTAGDPGTRLTSGSGADMASSTACNSCHGKAIGGVGHGGGYTEIKTCNNCHNFDYMGERNGGEGDFAHMIHKIHDAGTFTTLDDGFDASHVTYPNQLFNCAKCHNNDAGDAPDFNLAFTTPTRKNCGACHEEVNFETGENHGGEIQTDDANCNACHLPGGTTVGTQVIPPTDHTHISEFNPRKFEFEPGETVYDINDPRNTPEFDVTITMEDPANGEFYEAGETPLVTVTLTDHATGDPVPGIFYTGTPSADGDLPGGGNGLTAANLYVYGPRSQAVPVLTTGSTTDGGTSQRHSVLSDSTDPQVRTDGTGFKYELLDQIDQLQPGTYMVRFEGEGYGVVDGADFITPSTSVITFQVGIAEEEPKVSGDACINCHGNFRMHLSGAHPHNQPFDTDGCLGCHDLSGNYGEYIGNRVHAIHSASATGDLKATLGTENNRDWSHVAYPQDINNCTVCHTNNGAEVPVWRSVVPLACGGCHGVINDLSLGDEAIAASHMELMGADFDNPNPVPGCLVCHGEGAIADLFVEHNLVDYAVPPASDAVFD